MCDLDIIIISELVRWHSFVCTDSNDSFVTVRSLYAYPPLGERSNALADLKIFALQLVDMQSAFYTVKQLSV